MTSHRSDSVLREKYTRLQKSGKLWSSWLEPATALQPTQTLLLCCLKIDFNL